MVYVLIMCYSLDLLALPNHRGTNTIWDCKHNIETDFYCLARTVLVARIHSSFATSDQVQSCLPTGVLRMTEAIILECSGSIRSVMGACATNSFRLIVTTNMHDGLKNELNLKM